MKWCVVLCANTPTSTDTRAWVLLLGLAKPCAQMVAVEMGIGWAHCFCHLNMQVVAVSESSCTMHLPDVRGQVLSCVSPHDKLSLLHGSKGADVYLFCKQCTVRQHPHGGKGCGQMAAQHSQIDATSYYLTLVGQHVQN